MRSPSFLRGLSALLLAGALVAGSAPSGLEVEGAPEIPPELTQRMNQYLSVRSATFRGWHPTRREMLVSTRFGSTDQAHYVKTPEGARTQLTFSLNRVTPQALDPVAGEYFLFTMDEGGSEFYQIYRFDFSTGRSTLLTDGASRNTFGRFSRKGNRFSFATTRRTGSSWDIWVMNALDPAKTEAVYEGDARLLLGAWSPDDRRMLVTRYTSINEAEILVLDLETGDAEPLLSPTAENSFDRAVDWAPDGKGVYLISDRDSEYRRLWRVDLKTKAMKPLTGEIQWDVANALVSPDGTVAAYVVNEGGADRLHLLDLNSGNRLPGPALPMGTISLVHGGFHQRRAEFVFSMQTSQTPLDAYSYDLETGQLTRWTRSETGGLNTDTFPEPQLVYYPTFDTVEGRRREIPAFLLKPPKRFKPPYPVLIVIHGGPESQSKVRFSWGLLAYALNEMGIAELMPNVRGSTGYGKSYVQLDNGRKREDTVKDIGALLDWIEEQPDLDSQRVAVLGGSYGGYMSLATMTHYSDRLRCGIELFGISHFTTFLKNTQGYRRDLRRAEYGDERRPEMRDFFETIAPLNNAGKITVPMLVFQGRNDPRVPWTESQQIVSKVRENGLEVWYVLAHNEGHGLSHKENIEYWSYLNALFLERHLLQ